MNKKTVYCGLLAAVAIVVSSLEHFIPLQAFIPLPGIKLGIANCVILFTLIKLDFKSALAVLMCKSLIVSLLFTGMTAFVYSFIGGILSLIGMYYSLKCTVFFSVGGVSVVGAALFNIGQVVVASFLLGSLHIYKYLPFLLFASIVTGLITGILTWVADKNINIRWL